MFPLLRASLAALFVSVALTHVVEFVGLLRLFRLEAPLLERAIFVDAHLGTLRLGMVIGLLVSVCALSAAFGVWAGRGGHARVAGPGPWVLAMSLLALGALLVGATLTLTGAVIPLADSALRSEEFSVAAPGSSSSAFVTMANVMIGMGRAAVLDELARAESLAIVARLVAVPLAEAGVALGLVLFIGRVFTGRARSTRALEAVGAFALVFLVTGAGFGLRATRYVLVDRGAVELSVASGGLGALFLLGAVLFAIDALRRLEPISTPPM